MTPSSNGLRRQYRIAGVGLEIEANRPAFLDAVHARLQWSETSALETSDLRVRLAAVPEFPALPFDPAAARHVLEHPVAQIWYEPSRDQLLTEFGDGGRGVVDGANLTAELLVREGAEHDEWLGSHPLFTVAITELLKRQGLFGVHAAGAELDGRAILFAAASGAGKSTLSIAMARRGFGFLGDDRVFLHGAREALRVLPFPDDIDLRDGTPQLFEELRPILDTPKKAGWPKWKLRATELYQTTIPRECVPGLLIIPAISGEARSEFIDIDPHEALLELVPNVMLTENRATRAHLDALTQLTQQSRCLRLRTGRDFDEVAQRIRDMVGELEPGGVTGGR
jgi:hypothetical protein